MEERLERNWKLIMSLRGNIKDSDLATLIVFLLSFNYRQPGVFWEMKISMLRQVVYLNPFIRDVISKFCFEEKIDQSLERNIENLVKEHYSLFQRIILDWEFLELSEKEYNSAFDFIFEKINNLAGKFGAFSTSRSLRNLIQELTPKNSLTALDPACGSGSLLADFLSNGGKRVYGQDIDSGSLNYAKLRFLGKPNVNLALGDSLISEFFEGQMTDIVLCNPPYNLRIDREQHFHINQSFGGGMIKPGLINLAWVKLGLHNLKEDGIGIFILPLA